MADAPDALYSAAVSSGAKMIGSLLWRYAPHGHEAPFVWPAQSTLAEKTGQTRQAVHKQVKALERAGLVTGARRCMDGRWLDGWVLHTASTSVDATSASVSPDVNEGCQPTSTTVDEPSTSVAAASTSVDTDVNGGCTEAPLKPHGSPIEAQQQQPPQLALALPPPSIQTIEAGAFDGASVHELMYYGGAVDVAFIDHAQRFGKPGARLTGALRLKTEEALREGAVLSALARGSRKLEREPYWADRRPTTHRNAWAQLLERWSEFTGATVEDEPAARGPPTREAFEDPAAYQAAVDDYLAARHRARAQQRRA